MTDPRFEVLGIWKGSLIDCATWISEQGAGEDVIQFIPTENPRGFWIMLRVTPQFGRALRKIGAQQTPKWNFLP